MSVTQIEVAVVFANAATDRTLCIRFAVFRYRIIGVFERSQVSAIELTNFASRPCRFSFRR